MGMAATHVTKAVRIPKSLMAMIEKEIDADPTKELDFSKFAREALRLRATRKTDRLKRRAA